MSEIKKTYYEYALIRYQREGENMIIWSVYNGRNLDGTVNRTQIKIKDLDDIKIKESIRKSKNHASVPVGRARIEILGDVILKRRKEKIKKICTKLETK